MSMKNDNKEVQVNSCVACTKEKEDVKTRKLPLFQKLDLCDECYNNQLLALKIKSMIKFLIIAIALIIGVVISLIKDDNFTMFFYFWLGTSFIFCFLRISDKIANRMADNLLASSMYYVNTNQANQMVLTSIAFRWIYYGIKLVACLFLLIPYVFYQLLVWIYCELTLRKVETKIKWGVLVGVLLVSVYLVLRFLDMIL